MIKLLKIFKTLSIIKKLRDYVVNTDFKQDFKDFYYIY